MTAAVVVVEVVVLIGLAWNRLVAGLPGVGPSGPRVRCARSHRQRPAARRGAALGARQASADAREIKRNNGSGMPSLLPGDLLRP
jgi:hypothetical protein